MLIGLGGNLTSPNGGPEIAQKIALKSLEEQGAVIRAISPFYHTPAYPEGIGPDFVNSAAKIGADWSPQEMLSRLHGLEAALGRVRDARWGQRTLDLDLIACGDMVLPDLGTYEHWRNLKFSAQADSAPDTLILPHPRMQDRAFVLVPLAAIAPDWVHPVIGRSVAQMLADLPPEDVEGVRQIPSTKS
ncbi:MAG: 2-amino-4-hydroxy-6-hydroxymethyldihydropteridine diphosphokinase [Sulfitobacter sp.]